MRSGRWARRRLAGLITGLGLAGCVVAPGVAPGVPPDGSRTAAPRYGLLAIASATASSSGALGGYGAERGLDGNQGTEWAANTVRAPSAWWAADWGAARDLAGVRIKTGPHAGQAGYVIEVSADGATYTAVTGLLRNTTWGLETKGLPPGTRGRALRLKFANDAALSQSRFSVFEVELVGGTPSAPVPSTGPTATPTPGPTATPTPTPTPTGSPGTLPVPVIPVPNPGPMAGRGRLVVQGAPVAGLAVTIWRTTGGTYKTTTDAQGYFQVSGLAAGDYYAHYYNDKDRNKIGYWRSRNQRIDGTTGAAWPQVELYGVGMTNLPAMDARIGLPRNFTWTRQLQPTARSWFRVHSRPGTSFTLVYQSPQLAGDATAFTWNGVSGLSATNRYFWGFKWDAGAVGEGGNLYQAVYFNP